MHLNIVSTDAVWIFDKITSSIKSDEITITRTDAPDNAADINWFFNWYAWGAMGRPRTKYDMLFFTHINKGQAALAVNLINDADHTTTMSEWERVRLIDYGALPGKMTTILPGMDDDWLPPKVRVGITCRFYPDGRRREEDIIEMARCGALEGIELHVIGEGWLPVLSAIEKYGVQTVYYTGTGNYKDDYQTNRAIVPTLDYLWHTGNDTTLGVLDALACGVPIICPPTSFAVQFAIEPGSAYWYQNNEQLAAILRELTRKHEAERAFRLRIGEASRARTWAVYSRELVALVKRLRGE